MATASHIHFASGDDICPVDCDGTRHELGYCPHAAIVVANKSENKDTKLTLSPPSTPSTGSTRSKRSWIWSDDEDSSSESEPSLKKRAKRRSLSPISAIRSAGRSSSVDQLPHLPSHSADFMDLRNASSNDIVDKTQCLLDLPNKFRCLLLRPPRFGKTVLLSTLYHYYDVHGAQHFSDRFGTLAAKTSDPDTRQHLCLSFDLFRLRVYSDIGGISTQLSNQISFTLTLFLIKYATELRLSDPDMFLDDEDGPGDMFDAVFRLVEARGYSLFVGVDNYDAPTQLRSFAHKDYPHGHQGFASTRDIERLLDMSFWRPIMAETHAIDKLLITGTLRPNYPALESLTVGALPGLEAACGFTEQEALDFANLFLEQTPDIVDLRRSCGPYSFHSVEGGVVAGVLHPQLVIDQIYRLSHHPPHDLSPFRLLSDILELLPEESDLVAAVTIDSIIDLLATGFIHPGSRIDSAFDFDPIHDVTWNALYYAVLSRFEFLSPLNRLAFRQIHSRLDPIFGDRYQLQWKFLNAWYEFSQPVDPRRADDPDLLAELLTEVLCDLTHRTLASQREPTLRGLLELVIPKGQRPVDSLILLPTDVTVVQLPSYHLNKVLTVELTTLTLRGMWQGAHPNDDEPTIQQLRDLHQELIDLSEEELLARQCRVWSPTLNAMQSAPVSSFLTVDSQNRQILAVGGARVLIRKRS
ncbi:hypothetical protein C8R46DRAFT_1103300 [Mycena filopes]|nr:hypothetical protein C8R46DRAFT_1103300 [Mycena filopes]